MTKRVNTSAALVRAQAISAWTGLNELWLAQLGDLATLCAGSFAEEEASRVWTLHDLLIHASDASLIHGLAVPPQAAIERLIKAGACGAAVMEMFGPEVGYLVSRGPAGLHAASVFLPGAAEEVTAIGDSLALALVGAVAQAVLDRHAQPEPAPIQLN